jgi:diguanylate cyclase (GGDEF)-like protein
MSPPTRTSPNRIRGRRPDRVPGLPRPLTGLPNRAAFQRAYDDAVAAAEQAGEMFGLIMLDVDYFKDINDTLGHDAGDALLLALADQLKRAFRRGDTVARLGGDEFAVVLRDLKGEGDLTRPIEVLQSFLRTPIEHAGQSFTICASIGAAMHADPDADPLPPAQERRRGALQGQVRRPQSQRRVRAGDAHPGRAAGRAAARGAPGHRPGRVRSCSTSPSSTWRPTPSPASRP